MVVRLRDGPDEVPRKRDGHVGRELGVRLGDVGVDPLRQLRSLVGPSETLQSTSPVSLRSEEEGEKCVNEPGRRRSSNPSPSFLAELAQRTERHAASRRT